MSFTEQDRAALFDAHIRLGAIEAWLITLGMAVAANIRAEGVTVDRNAQMLRDVAMKLPGLSDDGGPGSAILEQIDKVGKTIQEAGQRYLVKAATKSDAIN